MAATGFGVPAIRSTEEASRRPAMGSPRTLPGPLRNTPLATTVSPLVGRCSASSEWIAMGGRSTARQPPGTASGFGSNTNRNPPPAATGSSDTGSSATGSSATGSSATGSSATGSSTTGSSATTPSSVTGPSGTAARSVDWTRASAVQPESEPATRTAAASQRRLPSSGALTAAAITTAGQPRSRPPSAPSHASAPRPSARRPVAPGRCKRFNSPWVPPPKP